MIPIDKDTPPNIREKSWGHYKERSDKLYQLSLAASFGTLFYLLSLEDLLPPATSERIWALQASWYMIYVSCVFGAIQLWLEMLRPLHAAKMTAEAVRDIPKVGEAEVYRRAEKKTNRFFMWGIPVFLHISLLVGTFVFSGFYRFSNL
jgi:hypothetical protein